MTDVSAIQGITDWFSISQASDLLGLWHWHSPSDWPVLAQYVKDPDLMGQMQRAFNNFIKTGQVWALIIGVIFGYLIRGLTA